MKVLIEASEAYRNQTGIGRFSRALIDHLPPSVDVVFSPPDFASRRHDVEQRTFTTRLMNFSQHVRLTQFDVVTQARREKPALIHSPSFFVPLFIRRIPTVATIFDLAYFDLPDQTDRFWGMYGRRMMPRFADHAAAIITTSNVSKEKIISHLGIPAEKIHCVYAGVDSRFHPIEDESRRREVLEKYHLESPFVLYAGAWHPHKNLPVLIRAFQGIDSVTLALTGKAHTTDQESVPRLAEKLNVKARFIGYVPDDDLPVLYSLARGVVLPSRYEGFGLPAVEAMACGAPVIVSDIPVLREISAGNALTFSTDAPDELRDSLLRILNSDSEYAIWREKALGHAQAFDWNRTAAGIIDVWEKVSRR